MQKLILIIDDDDVLNQGLQNAMKSEGYLTLSATSGEEAINLLKHIIPDAIILDRMMPGIDGIETMRQIRAKNIKSPILILTALGDNENVIVGLENGANDYLAKPFSVRELALRIKNLLNIQTVIHNNSTDFEWIDGEFMVRGNIVKLSNTEKQILHDLTEPVGNTVPANAMLIKRLRDKLFGSILNKYELTNVFSKGYKLIKKA
jgi:DNA-binding response OmpR family regulator